MRRCAHLLAPCYLPDAAPLEHAQRESKSEVRLRPAVQVAWPRRALMAAEPLLQPVSPELLVLWVELVWLRLASQVLPPVQVQFRVLVRQQPVWTDHLCAEVRAPPAAFP